MGKYTEMLECLGNNTGEEQKLIPEFFEANGKLAATLGNLKATDPVTKELMFLSFAVATRCEACIAYHTKMYKEVGGTREALAELYAVSVLMQGGPGGVYAGKVLEAFDEYSK